MDIETTVPREQPANPSLRTVVAVFGALAGLVLISLLLWRHQHARERERRYAGTYDFRVARMIMLDIVCAKRRPVVLPETDRALDAWVAIQELAEYEHIDRDELGWQMRTVCHGQAAEWTYLGRGLPVTRQRPRHVTFVSGAMRLPGTGVQVTLIFTNQDIERLTVDAARALLTEELAAANAGQRSYHPAALAALQSLLNSRAD